MQRTSTSPASEKQFNKNAGKKTSKTSSEQSLRINITIFGEPVSQAKELKQLGFVRSNSDLVIQGINTFYQQVVDQRLKTLRLKTLEKKEDEDTC